MKSLLLVDVSHIFRANWHASADKELSAAYELTVGKVHQLKSDYNYVAICCDRPPYLRTQDYPEYKAQREKPPAVMFEQFERIKTRLKADGFLLWECKGYEGEDVIASAVSLSPKEWSITIASNDKDLAQLVSDEERIRMVSTANNTVFNEAKVVEKYGVRPDQMRTWLALCGDKSDNIPGITGVGEKTAAKLIEAFGDLESILTAAQTDQLKPSKVKDALIADAAKARLAYRLVMLRTDAPINFADIFERRDPQPLADDSDNYDGFSEGEEPEDDIPISPPPKTPRPEIVPPANVNLTPQTQAALVQQNLAGASQIGMTQISEAQKNATQAHLAEVVKPKPEEPKPSNGAMVVAPRGDLQPQTINGAMLLAKGLFNSRLYTKFPTAEAIMAVIIRGREMGLGALTSLDCFHVVEGKPCLSAHLIVAKAKEHPDCEYLAFIGGDDTYAEYETKNRQNPKPTKLRYTIDQARQAGLCFPPRDGKQPGNWLRRPAELLRKTCAVQICRIEYPAASLGLLAAEEMGYDV